MKFRGLLVAALALAALGGGVYWSEKKKKADEGKPAADAPPKILTIADADFKDIRIAKAGVATAVSRGTDGKWKITEPKPLAADQDAVNSLVSSLSNLASDRLIEEKAGNLAEYGLAAPAMEVVVTKKDGKAHKVLIGDETPTAGGSFARLDGDPRIFTVASYVKTNLDKSSNDLRDKRLLTFDSDKLTRVELNAKNQTTEFGKNNQNEWQILKPKPYRADGSQVEELIRKLKDAKMDTSVSEDEAKKAAASFAGAQKVAVVTVSDASGNQQLEVRRDKDKNYFAKSSVIEGVFKVNTDLGEGLDKDTAAFRNKKLFDFGWNDPSKIEIGSVVYQKSGDKWMAGAKQMESGTVQNLIDKLRDLTSVKFADSAPGGVVLNATVTSNDGKRVEKVLVSKQGNTYTGKRDNEPAAYEIDGKLVEELMKAAADVKEFQPPKDEKKKK
jgi:hypothetical protein